MSFDVRIAITLAFAACGGSHRSTQAPKTQEKAQTEASPAAAAPTVAEAAAQGPNLILGWYCPDSAAGRPGVVPLLAKTPSWTAAFEVLERAIRAREVKRFHVLGFQGTNSGTLSVAGAATSGGVALAIGSYQGAEPCDVLDSLGKVRETDSTCQAATGGCALAVGMLEPAGGFSARPYDEDPEAVSFRVGGACEVGGNLVVDVDGDSRGERFSLSEVLASRVPVELPLQDEGGRVCEPSFAAMVGEGEPALLRIGVLDLDEYGRPEVLYRLGDEFLVFGAPNSPARMELVGRATLTSAPQ